MGAGFVTSTYYRRDLPPWVRAFNAARPFERRVGGRWDRVLPASAYAMMGPDDEPSEGDAGGLGRTFPHPIPTVEALDRTPFLDEVVADFAIAALRQERLGQDSVPDLLGVSFSATDYVGHTFGPDSHEIMDDIVRLDRTLARLFGAIDRAVGLPKVVVVLTADHGVAPLPEVMARGRPGSGPRRFRHALVDSAASRALTARWGAAPAPGWVVYNSAPLLFLNPAALAARRVALEDAERTAVAAIREVPGVHEAITAADLSRLRDAAVGGGPASDVVRSYHPSRGGDIYYFLDPYILQDDDTTGTGHGTLWRYDQQVPLLWFGPGIAPGVHREPAEVADIAPTLAAMLGMTAPGGAEGKSLGARGSR
jgi:hypothetical protein